MMMLFTGCSDKISQLLTSSSTAGTGETNPQQQTEEVQETTPFAVRTALREYIVADPEKGVGGYGRYTEIEIREDWPDSLKTAVREANERAKESVHTRVDAFLQDNPHPVKEAGGTVKEPYQYAEFSYIVTVTRADDVLCSILETDIENHIPDKGYWGTSWEGIYRHCIFHARSFETESGRELTLADITGEGTDLSVALKDALEQKYGVRDFAKTDSGAYVWTADYLGVRFYFDPEQVAKDKWSEVNAYFSQSTERSVHVSLPYTAFSGAYAGKAAQTPEAFIAQIDRGHKYALPYDDRAVEIVTRKGEEYPYAVEIAKASGNIDTWALEHAALTDDYFLFRSGGAYYFVRQNTSSYNSETYCYNFASPDGGYGRFENQRIQSFDSFLGQCQMALPFSPACAHMCENVRTFGRDKFERIKGRPHGHYAFRPENGRGRLWLHFALTDDALSFDTGSSALRLLNEITAVTIDEAGNETGEVTLSRGEILMPESVQGEAGLYFSMSYDYNSYDAHFFLYDCSTASGQRVRLNTRIESNPFYDGMYLCRITESVSKGEISLDTFRDEPQTAYIRVGNKDYPLIPNYGEESHYGEVIDFGDEDWWVVEGYVGSYAMTEEDYEESYGVYDVSEASLVIAADGSVVLEIDEEHYEGTLPEEGIYSTVTELKMEGPRENNTMMLQPLEEGNRSAKGVIDVIGPFDRVRISFEGIPATNSPSKENPISIWLTRTDTASAADAGGSGVRTVPVLLAARIYYHINGTLSNHAFSSRMRLRMASTAMRIGGSVSCTTGLSSPFFSRS